MPLPHKLCKSAPKAFLDRSKPQIIMDTTSMQLLHHQPLSSKTIGAVLLTRLQPCRTRRHNHCTSRRIKPSQTWINLRTCSSSNVRATFPKSTTRSRGVSNLTMTSSAPSINPKEVTTLQINPRQDPHNRQLLELHSLRTIQTVSISHRSVIDFSS